MLQALRGEGLGDVELACVATNAKSWDQRAPGFDRASFPIMIDTDGVFYIYGATSNDAILIDKRGRLVVKENLPWHDQGIDPELVAKLNQRIRELHAE
jgi:hypothetical protein